MHPPVLPGWGGDELAVLLPGMDERAAQVVRERIQSLIELNNQFYSGQPLGFAIGIACCQSGEGVEAALHKADQAMYEEKRRYYQQIGAERRR